MSYQIDCRVAREEPEPEPVEVVFKMRKTRRELSLARKLHRESGLTSEEALEYAHEIVQGTLREETPMGEDSSGEAESQKQDGQHNRRSDDEETPPAYVVSHPWHIVDYHLYLCSAERGKDGKSRREAMYLFDGVDCRRLSYEEFAADRSLSSGGDAGQQPQLLFSMLPIAERQHAAEKKSPFFAGRQYVLGFDYTCKTLYARHFDWFPHDVDDLWCVWENGWNAYTVTVPDLIRILQSSLGKGEIHVGMGILSSSPYCLALDSSDDPGLEIVIATLWCQWLWDFSGILFQDGARGLSDFQASLAEYVEQGRLILQRASYRAWFAVRDGVSKEQYSCQSTINQYINDLYTFEKSATEDGSLKGRPWTAPGLETCHQIRERDRMQRREQAVHRLENLFIPEYTGDDDDNDDDDNSSNSKDVLQRMLARTQESLEFSTAAPLPQSEIPQTPSPPPQPYTASLDQDEDMSPGSSGMVTPASGPYDHFAVRGYDDIPLSVLLEQAHDLVLAQPELDTLANRGRVEALLKEIGVGNEARDDEERLIRSTTLEYESDGWTFEEGFFQVL